MEWLLPPGPIGADLDQILDRLDGSPVLPPFDERSVGFVAALSRRILTSGEFREYPELLVLAHWFRAANLARLRGEAFEDPAGRIVRVPRGLVFHLAPANVDSIFAYSWLLSLLCGNANVARVSRRRSAQMQAFFAAAGNLLAQPVHQALAERNVVLSYDHDPVVTGALSARCQLRVVWGGDRTVHEIRAVPLAPLATELVFADRFSIAVLRSEAVLAADEGTLAELAHGFYNDAFWFNQQACSSPRAVVWIGPEGERARARFWPALQAEITLRQPENAPSQVMDRSTTLFRLAHDHPGAKAAGPVGAQPSRIRVDRLTEGDRLCHDGNGLFIELDRGELEDLLPLLSGRDQTIAQFGFGRAAWQDLIGRLPARAIDRIVPIGQALSFSQVWDGVCLVDAFTRTVEVAVPEGGGDE